MTSKLLTACALLLAGGASSPAWAETPCRLAEAGTEIALEVERFSAPVPRQRVEELAHRLVPSPCKTSPSPRLALDTVELGLLAEDLRQGSEQLEQRRLNR